MINPKLLLRYGAEKCAYPKNTTIFHQGESARYYYEIMLGDVKMCNYNPEGKEFIQGIFSVGRCFGEPPLFGDFNYPAHAIALTDCEIWRLPKDPFLTLLREHPDVHFQITSAIAHRLYYKAIIAQEISHEEPTHRILRLLQYLKKDIYKISEPYAYKVELTRQQIADLTGLRVETAIRAIKTLEKDKKIKIIHRRIWI